LLRSFSLYRRLLSIHLRSQMHDRASFLMEIFSTALVNGISFISLALIVQRFAGIGGWSIGEIALLYGIVESAFAVMDMIFSGFDPQNFGNQVRRGLLDQMLLRPVNISLQVFGSYFILRRLGRVFQGGVVFFLALVVLNIQWTPAKLLVLGMTFTGPVLFFGGLFITGATITFWTLESIEAINIFTYGGVEMASYPMHIYPGWMRSFFTYILPAIFLNYYPAMYILEKPDPFHMPAIAPWLSLPVGIGVLALSLVFWNLGLRHYQSAGT
jgi:ABC-2 type transport system permease protein